MFNKAKGSKFGRPKPSKMDVYEGTEDFIRLEMGNFVTPEMKEMVKLFRKIIEVIIDLGKKAENIFDYSSFEH